VPVALGTSPISVIPARTLTQGPILGVILRCEGPGRGLAPRHRVWMSAAECRFDLLFGRRPPKLLQLLPELVVLALE